MKTEPGCGRDSTRRCCCSPGQSRLKVSADRAASKQIEKINSRLDEIDRTMVKRFPLDDADTEKLLTDMSPRIDDLYNREQDALTQLAGAVG